jgi:integration host factor subunit beta
MTRSDLVEQLAERFGQLTQRDADSAVKAILEAMGDAGARPSHRNPRLRQLLGHAPPAAHGRNPRTGQSVPIPERRVPHFKPGKALRQAIEAPQPLKFADSARGIHDRTHPAAEVDTEGSRFFALFAFALNNQQDATVHLAFGHQWRAP